MDRPLVPHPPLQTPSLKAPPGATCCHAHIFGPSSEYPWWPERGYTPPDALLSQYEAMLRALGLSRAVLVQPSVYGTDNRCQLDALAAASLPMRGVMVLRPDIDPAELRSMHDAGVRGVRFNLNNPGGLALDALETLARKVAELGWHIQLLVKVQMIADLEQRIAGLPTVTVVDHFGQVDPALGVEQPGFQALLRLVATGRTWVKLSSPYGMSTQSPAYADLLPFAHALVAAAPERMVWGTNWPHPNASGPMKPADHTLLDVLADWAPDEQVRNRILSSNAGELYDF